MRDSVLEVEHTALLWDPEIRLQVPEPQLLSTHWRAVPRGRAAHAGVYPSSQEKARGAHW
ncbi:hypothetical protein GCM10022267_18980 [Lentzea roselyniae]|uniref:Uncharacterized protein n=1 Tax=Lentzea roselyniae TaxID=531940 RepID=A0ABP7AHB1_9PSEU